MLVYFAEPIDFDSNSDNWEVDFRNRMEHELLMAGCAVYRPASAWNVVGEIDEQMAKSIDGVNRQALRRADAVVARLPEGVATQGVPAEIEFATRHMGIPVLVVGDVGVSLMANSMVSVLAEEKIEFLGKQVVLLANDYKGRSEYVIRYSAPQRLAPAHPTDAGIDLYTSEDVIVPSGVMVCVPTGTKMAMPVGTFGWIVARSSTYNTHQLQVLPGIIDQEYTGELAVNVLNLTGTNVVVKEGTRLGQLVLFSNWLQGFDLRRVDEHEVHLAPTRRGSNGFGSTGR